MRGFQPLIHHFRRCLLLLSAIDPFDSHGPLNPAEKSVRNINSWSTCPCPGTGKLALLAIPNDP